MRDKFKSKTKLAKDLLLDHLDREAIKDSFREDLKCGASLLTFITKVKRSPRQRALAESISLREIVKATTLLPNEVVGAAEILYHIANTYHSHFSKSLLERDFPDMTDYQYTMIISYLKRKGRIQQTSKESWTLL